MVEGRFAVVQLLGSFGLFNSRWVIWDRQADDVARECGGRSEAEEMVEHWNRDWQQRVTQEQAAAHRRELEAYLAG